MKKVIIYGAGGTGIRIERQIRNQYDIVAFIDSDIDKQGTTIDDISCIDISQINDFEFDEIIIGAATGYSEMIQNLSEMGVRADRISTEYIGSRVHARETFLRNYAEICTWKNDKSVCVGEAGVFRGEYARIINDVFHDNNCYLYDTYEGFSEKDITEDELKSDVFKTKNYMNGHFADTSIQLVLSRMPYPDKCIPKKGYFPDTFEEKDKRFGFVSLDMDLYRPMKAGLECFYPILIIGGGDTLR